LRKDDRKKIEGAEVMCTDTSSGDWKKYL